MSKWGTVPGTFDSVFCAFHFVWFLLAKKPLLGFIRYVWV